MLGYVFLSAVFPLITEPSTKRTRCFVCPSIDAVYNTLPKSTLVSEPNQEWSILTGSVHEVERWRGSLGTT
jgi:hypothetical protein